MAAALGAGVEGVRVSRIDPEAETRAYSEEILRTAGANLDAAGRALLEEDLRSPCTEEIAVFRAFARVVDEGAHGFVVVDKDGVLWLRHAAKSKGRVLDQKLEHFIAENGVRHVSLLRPQEMWSGEAVV